MLKAHAERALFLTSWLLILQDLKKRLFFVCLFDMGPHPAVLRASSWLCVREPLLAGLGGPYEMPRIEPMTMCKASTFPLYYFSCPAEILSFDGIRSMQNMYHQQ